MPRLSLYNPQKGNNYKFIDKAVWEMFQIGGTDALVHKYLGAGDPLPGEASPTKPQYNSTNPFQIQDLLFLENRDRKYDPDVYILRGVYNIQDIDFNLSQFGLFLQNDTIFITFHINDTVEKLGRKIMAGDVIELPHLKDEYALNDLNFALKRFYVVEEVNRAAEGFSVTWYPHLYRAKCKPLVDSQEFKQILDSVADDSGEDTTTTLRDVMSTYEKEMQITQAVLDQAEADAPKSGYETRQFYTLKVDEAGKPELVTVDTDTIDATTQTQATDVDGNLLYQNPWDAEKSYLLGDQMSYGANLYEVTTVNPTTGVLVNIAPTDENGIVNTTYYSYISVADPLYVAPTSASTHQTVDFSGYPGYLVGDGIPANGAPLTSGISFPTNPVVGQFCLRTDYMPKRLFRFSGSRWVKVEDDVRMTMSNNDTRNTYKTGFINNTENTNIDKMLSDVFFAATNNTFRPTDPVQSFTMASGLVITRTAFNAKFGIEVFINEVPVKSTTTNVAGKLAFTINNKIKAGDKIEWVLYGEKITQRQSLSKVLKPKADL